MTYRVLIVDDDTALADVLALHLQSAGFETQTCTDGLQALRLSYDWRPSLIVLDLMLPRMDGYEVCSRLRDCANVPILMLTALSHEKDVIKGFQSGADDYMRKPFALSELEARIRALLRFTPEAPCLPRTIECGGIAYDALTRRVTFNGKPLRLRPTEIRLLDYMLRNQGRVLSHSELLRNVWGPEYEDARPCLKVYIRYLRQHLGESGASPRYIDTVTRVGYVLHPPRNPSPRDNTRAHTERDNL